MISEGRVCIPIDPDNCEKFDPLSVPTLQTLIDEINAYVEDDVKEQGRRKVAGTDRLVAFASSQFLSADLPHVPRL